MSTLRALLRLGRPPWRGVAVSVGLGSLTVLAGVGLMSVAGYLISRAAEHPPILSLTVAIVAVRAFGIGRPVARYFERLQSHDLAFRVLARMRVSFYRTLEPRVPGRIEGYRRGELLSGMVEDVDAMQGLLLRGIAPPLVALTAGVVSVTLAALILPGAAVILAVGLVTGGLAVPVLAWRAGARTGRRHAQVRSELTAELVEALRAAPELAVLGADAAAIERIERLDAELIRMSRRDALASGLVEALGTLVAGATVVGVLAVCARATSVGALDRVLVAALALGAMAAFEAVSPLPAAALGLRRTLESGRRLLEVGAREAAIADPLRPAVMPMDTSVRLEGVSFDHRTDDEWGVRDLDVRIVPGRRVALVGPSGAGKSTVASLLVRFVDPDTGRLALGGTDARSVRQRDLRSAVALDGQEAYLFSSTIRENVRLAKPGAGDDEIEGALGRAGARAWVASLPDGLDTHVGEEGTRVSGGERRRIALARSFLADAPVLVLDEPTAHLDPAAAAEVMREVTSVADDRAVLVITHRTEGLADVDDVLTLRRGRLEPA